MPERLDAEATAELLRDLDALDNNDVGAGGYEAIAAELAELDSEREISLYLQRLDYLDGRLADHPKYFEHLARSILGITPNPHPNEVTNE